MWYNTLHRTSPSTKGLRFGIEIEIEGRDIHSAVEHMRPSHWITENDNSLRNGLEFKSRVAVTYEEAAESISQYGMFLESCNAKASARTSVHIHVNVQDLTDAQLKSFVWLSFAMEPVIMKFCTVQRNHNGYCLPAFKSTNQTRLWNSLLTNLGSRERLHMALRSMPKYAAIGGFRMRDLGTIEFRMFPGCPYAPQILWYLDILRSIYTCALDSSVQQLQDRKTSDGVLSLISSVIMNNRKRVTLDELSELTEVGIRMANDIVRERISMDDVKAMHKALFPSKYKPLDAAGWAEVCASSDIKTTLKQFDPEDIAVVFQSEFSIFQKLVQSGLRPADSTFKAVAIWKEMNV